MRRSGQKNSKYKKRLFAGSKLGHWTKGGMHMVYAKDGAVNVHVGYLLMTSRKVKLEANGIWTGIQYGVTDCMPMENSMETVRSDAAG